MELKKNQLSFQRMPTWYACVEGVLTSVIFIPMLVLISYKKSSLRRSPLVRISYISEYFLPTDLFL